MNARYISSLNVGTGMVLLALCFGAVGCASPMALKAGTRVVDTSSKSIAVFTLRTQNAFKPSYRPNVKVVEIVNETTSAGRTYRADPAYIQDDDACEYLISVNVTPGTHSVGRVMGQSIKFPLVAARFAFPVNGQFEVLENSVTYIGHVNMVNRERQDGEARSGSVIPLVDQAVAGYSGGTFDITVSDRSVTDIPLFIQTYPCLDGIEITPAVMQRQE